MSPSAAVLLTPRDKGELDYHGLPQARWIYELLATSCERRFVPIS